MKGGRKKYTMKVTGVMVPGLTDMLVPPQWYMNAKARACAHLRLREIAGEELENIKDPAETLAAILATGRCAVVINDFEGERLCVLEAVTK